MELLDDLEGRLSDAVHSLLKDAKAAEPVIEDAVEAALAESGAPGEVAAALSGLVKALRDHFASLLEPAPAPEPPPDPQSA